MNIETQNKPNLFASGTMKIQVFYAKTMEVILKTHTWVGVYVWEQGAMEAMLILVIKLVLKLLSECSLYLLR